MKPVLERELFIADVKSVVLEFEYIQSLTLNRGNDRARGVNAANEGVRWPIIAERLKNALAGTGDDWAPVPAGVFASAATVLAEIDAFEAVVNRARALGLYRELPMRLWSPA